MTALSRIAVVGSTGSGKTTLARQLAERLGLPYVELDALHWEPNWTEATDEALRARVLAATESGRWVVDGNYSKVHDLTLARAQTLVWLDYSFARTSLQLLRRTFGRATRHAELWSGNRESLRMALLSRDSILLWLLRSYGRNRRRYLGMIEGGFYPQLAVVHLRSPRETRAWLASLPADPSPDPLRSVGGADSPLPGPRQGAGEGDDPDRGPLPRMGEGG